MGFIAEAVRSAQCHTPTHFHFKREKAEQHLAVSIVRERMEEDRSSKDLLHRNNLFREEQIATVRVCPFSVGACPMVIFLKNLSLVSNTVAEREDTEQFLVIDKVKTSQS